MIPVLMMFSRIKLKASYQEINALYKNRSNPDFFINGFDFYNDPNVCNVVIKHSNPELKLSGLYSLSEFEFLRKQSALQNESFVGCEQLSLFSVSEYSDKISALKSFETSASAVDNQVSKHER